MNKKGFIFDLDGVIVDTAKYHFLAWKKLANDLGIDFTEEENEQLKGVSRVKSLEKILDWGNKSISDEKFTALMAKKNDDYLSHIAEMDESEILIDVPRIYKRTVIDDWAWAYPTYEFTIPKNNVKAIVIDPSNLMADVDKTNNAYEKN